MFWVIRWRSRESPLTAQVRAAASVLVPAAASDRDAALALDPVQAATWAAEPIESAAESLHPAFYSKLSRNILRKLAKRNSREPWFCSSLWTKRATRES